MKKYIVYIIGFMSCCMTSVEAQQDAISNHYWVTPSVNNPALIGMFNDSTVNVSASILDYWVIMPNAPKLINVALEIPFASKKIALGAFFRQEEYFLFKESSGSLSFNYTAPMPKINSEIRIGLGLGFFENRIDFSGVSIKDLGDGLILDGVQSQMAFQFSLAVAFRYKRFCTGINIPYIITNKNSTIGSLTYGNHNLDSTSFKKPLVVSLYAKQSLLPKTISQDKHALDVVLLANFNPTLGGDIYAPYDMRINFGYRFGGFMQEREGKKMAAKVLSLDAIKLGLGYRFAWKNNETKERTGHGGNAMFGFEIGRFLEIDYIVGVNNSITTVGVTHEVICKIKIGTGNKKSNNSKEVNNRLELLQDSIDSVGTLYNSIRVDMDTILLKTIPSLELEIEELKSETERLEKESQLNKKELKEKIKELEDELEIWKRIVGGKQNVGVEIKTPPNSTVIKKK